MINEFRLWYVCQECSNEIRHVPFNDPNWGIGPNICPYCGAPKHRIKMEKYKWVIRRNEQAKWWQIFSWYKKVKVYAQKTRY